MSADEGARCLEQLTGLPAETWTPRALTEPGAERTVLEYRTDPAANGPGPAVLVVKFYDSEAGTVRAFDALRSVADAIERAPGRLSLAVPRPIHHDRERRLVVQSRVPGEPLSGTTRRFGIEDSFELAGRALAALHGVDVPGTRGCTLEDHTRDLIRPHPSRLAEQYPEYRAAIERTLDELRRADAQWSPIETRPLHRDFQLRQLFRDGDRIWVVDWDDHALGDPVFDVAYFLVYLENHLEPDANRQLAQAFLRGYLDARPAAGMDRVPTYRRFNLLRRACRRFRLRDDRWEPRMRDMLERLDADPG